MTSFQEMTFSELLSDAEVFVDGDWVESKDQDPNGDVRLIQLADIGDGFYIDKSSRFLNSETAKRLKCTYLKEGDILVARMPDPLGRACIFPKSDMPCVTVVDVCIIRPNQNKVDNRWLMHTINSPVMRQRINEYVTGTTRQRISRGNFSKLKISVPPLAEQRRIASILDQADELRQKRQQAIEKLDQLLQATFIEMFGDPVSNPKGWDKKLLSDLVTIDAPLVEPMEKEFENLLHYGPDRISKDSGKLLPALTAKEDMLISKKFLCDDRHILYSKIRPYLNKVAMVQEKCLCSADVYPVEPKSQLTKHFLWHILRSKSFLDHAETFSNRANIPKINRNQFLQYECIVPTMEAQQKFENTSKDIQRQIDFQNLSLELIEKLFSSLQNQAFNGTL
ncbi:restriction endonuclease subunit S [Acinetobacter pseudolwoffii]|uniref:restriction endonuclease subunit S n=1 Tax=Acinetobacter pseudolwoffii TaxID=2053287 RepID=UPI002574EF43|nr:restriction endonuclease subunit S [Acinetobacter pseudolwoffii]MDM1340218.1 restriction endonuclease subunit S [Acinetobacter pseudolwoffii]